MTIRSSQAGGMSVLQETDTVSSTQVLAPHIATRTLRRSEDADLINKIAERGRRDRAEDHEDVFVHTLRAHMTRGVSQADKYNDDEIFDCSEGWVMDDGPYSKSFVSGLYSAFMRAYSDHLHLHLRPDDLWLAVGQGVSAHLQYEKNGEKFRKFFVDHEGQKAIEVMVRNFLTGNLSGEVSSERSKHKSTSFHHTFQRCILKLAVRPGTCCALDQHYQRTGDGKKASSGSLLHVTFLPGDVPDTLRKDAAWFLLSVVSGRSSECS